MRQKNRREADELTLVRGSGNVFADLGLKPLSAGSIARAVELTNGIDVGDDEIFPDDITV